MGSLDRLKDISGFMADLPLDDTLGSATTRAIGGMLGTIALEIEREREQSAECGSYADAAEWVEQNGGLDAVIERWAGSVPSAHVKRIIAGWKEKRSRLAAHARRLEHLVGERRRQIKRLNSEIESMRPRLMPEGCEWPRHESGDPVRIGDEFIDHEGLLRKVERIVFTGDGYLLVSKKGTYYLRRYGEPVKRPAFLAVDGEPLEVGQTVWDADGDEFRVLGLYGGPVDEDFPDHTVSCRRAGAEDYEITMCVPSQLTHTKPEQDSWERWRTDLVSAALGYAQDAYHGLETDIDFDEYMRRARALAERGE